MREFSYNFKVQAPIKAVTDFHADTRALKTLNPPFIYVQLKKVDPMAEGSVSEFTLWFLLLPIKWRAVHTHVSEQGFTDTQEEGPLAFWQHTHQFESLGDDVTQIHENIVYEYPSGWWGFLSRILFNHLSLKSLFTYRKWATRQFLSQSGQDRK